MRSEKGTSDVGPEAVHHRKGVSNPRTLYGRGRNEDGQEDHEGAVASDAQGARGQDLQDEASASVHELCDDCACRASAAERSQPRCL